MTVRHGRRWAVVADGVDVDEEHGQGAATRPDKLARGTLPPATLARGARVRGTGVQPGLTLLLLAVVFVSLIGSQPAVAQQTSAAPIRVTTAPATSPAAPDVAPLVEPPADFYGPWVLVAPLITILLAILWRQVIPALAIGILVAAYMLAWSAAPGQYADVAIGGLTTAVETFLIGAIADTDHVKIVLFTLTIGGMVGIIAANGGTAAIVGAVARWASNRRRGQLATWLAGLLVFFDDYANAMIVGPSMRPVCDRLKISRAKLAYMVDSTAAPVASIALVGTWIGAEIGFIHDGLSALTERPAFLEDVELDKGYAYNVFLSSIPYRFYPILALVMVLLVGLLDRDFGPMRKAERSPIKPNATGGPTPALPEATAQGKAWYAGVPVLVLVVVTLGLLVLTGWLAVQGTGETARDLDLIQQIVSSGDSYNSILYGALAAIAVAVVISLATRALTIAKTVDGATAAMARMFPTMIVLVLAWSLSAAMQELQLGEVARTLLQQARFDARWLPLLIFVAACVVSFATGTSWGTMGILCPAAVTIAAGLLADVPPAEATPLFYASVGAVLAGAVFGDHCSPISDTTVLSSLASECSLESHVWTQMPYALTVAAVSIICGDVLCRITSVPAWAALLIGSALLLVILLAVGRKPHGVYPSPEHDRGGR